MNHWMRTVWALLFLLSVSGCSSWSNPFQGTSKEASKEAPKEAPKVVEEVVTFIEPQTKESTGLTRVWRERVSRWPGQYWQHPRQVVVTDTDVFVGTFHGRVARLARESGELVWEAAAGDRVTGGVAVDGQRVFAGTRSGEMVAFDRESGTVLWRSEVSAPVVSAPVVGGGKVLFLTLDNRTYALNAADGKRLWMHSTPPEALVVMGAATPTLDGPVVYVGYSSGDLFALSVENGIPLWVDNLSVSGGRSELDLLQGVGAGVVVSRESDAPVVGVKKVFAVNHQGRAVALAPRNGGRIWEHKMSSIQRPCLLGNHLVFSDMDGNVVALSAGEGAELWRTRVSDGLLTAPVAMGSKVLVADNRGRLITLDGGTGQVLGMDRLSDAILADPVVVDHSVFLWTNEGNFLRYDF